MAHHMEHLCYPKIWNGGRKTTVFFFFFFFWPAVWDVGT